jgi:hypothetical protein
MTLTGLNERRNVGVIKTHTFGKVRNAAQIEDARTASSPIPTGKFRGARPPTMRRRRSAGKTGVMNRGTPWKKLTRADLANFDSLATDAVLTAMAHGAVGRVTAKGHVNIRSPHNGETMAVSRNTGDTRAGRNIRGDLKRLFPHLKKESDIMHSQNGATTPVFAAATDPSNPSPVAAVPDQLLECPAKGCDKEFATEGARYAHVRDDHYTCGWEGCDLGPDGGPFVGTTQQSISGHVNVRHRGNKPWEHRSKDPEAYKAAAVKANATKAAKRAEAAKQQVTEKVEKTEIAVTANSTAKGGNADDKSTDKTAKGEHRGLPKGEVKHRPMTAAAKLAAIREILGPDPRVAKLQAEVDELKAHLDLVREALNITSGK